MIPSYLVFAKDFKGLFFIAKLRDKFFIFTPILLSFLYYFFLFIKFPKLPNSLHILTFYISLSGIVIGSIFSAFLDFFKSHLLSNIFFYLELKFLKTFIFKKFYKKHTTINFKAEGEESQKISQNFPLYRYVNKFKNEKLVNINIKNDNVDVIFIILESFRAKNVGVFNLSNEKCSPYFDKLSKDGILFKNFYSTGGFSSKSLVSILFGINPLINIGAFTSLINSSLYGIPQILKQKNYQNTLINGSYLSFEDQFKFFENNSFDNLFEKSDITKKYPSSESNTWNVYDEHLMDFSIDFLKENNSNKNFLILRPQTNHRPWKIPKNYSKTCNNSKFSDDYNNYLNSFQYSDYSLGLFIEKLKENDLYKNKLIFVMGDHGQVFEDDNLDIKYSKLISEEFCHIPLLILSDDYVKKPTIINQVSSEVDLVSTLTDILNIKHYQHSIGSSLIRKTANKTIYFNDTDVSIGCRNNHFKYVLNLKNSKEFLYKMNEKNSKNIINDEEELSKLLKQDTKLFYSNIQELKNSKSFAPQLFIKKELTISNNMTEDKIFKKIKTLNEINTLNLKNTKNISNEFFLKILKKFPKITDLNVSNNYWVTDSTLNEISTICKNLKTINLSSCNLITDKGVQHLLKKLFSISEINLENCWDLENPLPENLILNLSTINILRTKANTKKTLNIIFNNCPSLFVLLIDLQFSKDEDIASIKNFEKKYFFIYIQNSQYISDKYLENFLLNAPNLEDIFLNNSFANEIFCSAAAKLKRLKVIYIINNQKISEKALLHFNSSSINLLVLKSCPKISKNIESKLSKNIDFRQT